MPRACVFVFELAVKSKKASLLEWPITVGSGVVLCGVALAGVEALRSHGLIVLVMTIIASLGMVRSFSRPKSSSVFGKVTVPLQICTVCGTSTLIVWAAGFLPSIFAAGIFCLTQICITYVSADDNRTLNGATGVMLITSALVALFGVVAVVTYDIIILLLCLVGLIYAVYDLSFAKQRAAATGLPKPNWISAITTVDLWCAAFLLPTEQTILYFSARLLTLFLPAFLHSFETWIAPAILDTYRNSGQADFVRAMARVNLALFLVAAAITVMFMSIAFAASESLFQLEPTGGVIGYLLLATFVPAALGHSWNLANLLHPLRVRFFAQSAGLGCAAVSLTLSAGPKAHDIALAFLIYHMVAALIHCIQNISHHGIWPGPTALLAKQIRLLD